MLKEMVEKAELDTDEIDNSLEYWEAKEEIEKRFHTKLKLRVEEPVVRY